MPVDIKQRTLALRGMDVTGPSIRDGITLSVGRLFAPGARKIVVGDRLAAEFSLGVGDVVHLSAVDWIALSNPNYGLTSTQCAPPSTDRARYKA